MLSRETLEKYRRMTPRERLVLTLQAIRVNRPYLAQGSPEVVARRLERIHFENDRRNKNLLRAFARLRDAP